MMPPVMLVPHTEFTYSTQTSPELRRMEMFNRARREEMESLIYSINPRDAQRAARAQRNAAETISLASAVQRLRGWLGGVLVNAGNRIQNPA